MKVNMPMAVTAADTIKRTITGTIVTWNEQGNTSVGPTVFAADSIEIKPVKLLHVRKTLRKSAGVNVLFIALLAYECSIEPADGRKEYSVVVLLGS